MEGCPNPFGLMFSSVLEIDIGVITSFAGGLGNVPPGWFLCDGTNGTTDLRDQFVPAAGPIFAVGNEGGLNIHWHGFTSNGHSHEFPSGTDVTSGTSDSNFTTSRDLTGHVDTTFNRPTYYALAYIEYRGI